MPPADNGSDGDEKGVLDPEELDISDDERVLEIEDGRYVIASEDDVLPDEPPPGFEAEPVPDDETAGRERRPVDPAPDERDAADASSISAEAAIRAMRDRVASVDSLYGFDVTAKFEGDVDRRELYSNDVVTTFENLLVWYAQHVGGDTPVEDVIGILLFESNVPVRYPATALRRLVEESGLRDDAEISELLAYTDDDRGVRFPP